MLAEKIINYNKNVSTSEKINLKGILVGNGVADWNYDAIEARFDFAFTHHLTSYEHRLDLNKYCIMEINEEKCIALIGEVNQSFENINMYDYLQKCATPTNEYGDKDYFSSYYLKSPWAFHNLKQKQQKLKEKLDRIKSQNLRNDNIFKPPQPLKASISPPCLDTTQINKYFNREEVKRALHVKMDKTWELCSSDVSKRYSRQDKGSIWAYPTILNSGVRVLIYSGDTDVSVPFNGNQAWIKNLNLEVVKKWTQWRAYGDKNNVSGYYIKYKGLTFCTVKGTGHMVPEWKSKEAYYMFSKFLNDEDF
jgi:carboxypeptidase C (cathepsin A)